MSPQKINEEEKAVGIGCCRICLISKVNCVNCKFIFALRAIEYENIIKKIEKSPNVNEYLNYPVLLD